MKRKTKAQAKELTKTILEMLAVGSLLTVVGTLAGGRKAEKLAKAFTQYSRARVRQTLKRLRLQNYISYDPDDEESAIILTEKGMRRLCSHQLSAIFNLKKKRWDYLWRVVMFDVPERQMRARKQLRHELLSAGFYPLQRSVFVAPYECMKEITSLCDMLMVKPHVLYFIAASLGPKEQEVRHFYFGRKDTSH